MKLIAIICIIGLLLIPTVIAITESVYDEYDYDEEDMHERF